MTLYHTSYTEVPLPDLLHTRHNVDFGAGFYLTDMSSQAERYSERFIKRQGYAVINVYEFDDKPKDYTRKTFKAYNGPWLDYVTLCRKEQQHDLFDCIEGPVADDDVFDTCDLYFQGLISRSEALRRLRYKKPNHQICLASQRLMDGHLHFVKSYIVKPDESK